MLVYYKMTVMVFFLSVGRYSLKNVNSCDNINLIHRIRRLPVNFVSEPAECHSAFQAL